MEEMLFVDARNVVFAMGMNPLSTFFFHVLLLNLFVTLFLALIIPPPTNIKNMHV
jgi:hypothetical protein